MMVGEASKKRNNANPGFHLRPAEAQIMAKNNITLFMSKSSIINIGIFISF